MPDLDEAFQAQLAAARREQILAAAAQVIAEKGYHRATIKDIAGVAGVADGTIYNYFANKRELLESLLARLNQSEERSSAFVANRDADVRTFFVTYLRQRLAFLRPNLQLFRALLPELMVNPELQELYYRQLVLPDLQMAEAYFSSWMAVGSMRDMDPALAVRAIAATLMGLLVMQIMGDDVIEDRWDDLPEALAIMLFDGLSL